MTIILSLLGCYEFVGDEGQLGFMSNLILQDGVAWTPDHGIAGGTDSAFLVSAVLDDHGELVEYDDTAPEPELWGRTGLEALGDEANQLRVLGPRRGTDRVVFEGLLPDGEIAYDHFELRYRPIASVLVADASGQALERIAVVPGAEVSLGVQARDRWSRPLGYRADDLVVDTDGQVGAWLDEGELLIEATGDGGLYVDLGEGEGFLAVKAGQPARSERVLVHEEDGVQVFQQRTWTAEGLRLFGVPAAWDEEFTALGPDLASRPRR